MSAEKFSNKCVKSVKECVTMKGNYMIYRLVDNEGREETLFYLPEKDADEILRSKAYRLLELAQYKSNGFSVYAIAYVDKETYLNARLDYRVKEYCQLDRDEQDTKRRRLEMTPETYVQTLEMIQDMKWNTLKTISMCIRRLMREDFDIHNEIGIQLYDQYLQAIL